MVMSLDMNILLTILLYIDNIVHVSQDKSLNRNAHCFWLHGYRSDDKKI